MDDDEQADDEPGGGPPSGPSASERSSRLTTTIPRPVHRRASDVGRSRLGIRRRGPSSDRISSRRSGWLFGLAAVVVAGAIAAALFGLPVRTWFDQNDQIRALDHELGEMQNVNRDLQGEVDRLLTDDGVREAAREELGQVQAGDRRITLLEPPALPRDLPVGWPYGQIDQILTMRATGPAPGTVVDGSVADDDDGGSGGFEPVGAALPPATSVPPPTSVPATIASAQGAAATSTAPTSSVAAVGPTTTTTGG